MSNVKKSKAENRRTLNALLQHYEQIARSMWVWTGLPETVDSDIIERALYEDGSAAVFFDSKAKAYFGLPAFAVNEYNLYGLPNRMQVFGYAVGYEKEIIVSKFDPGTQNGVWVRNNFNFYPTRLIVEHYVTRIQNIQRTQDINVNSLKTPYVFTAAKEQLNQVRNFYTSVEENSPAVATWNANLLNDFQVLNTNAKSFLPDLDDHQRVVENELLTVLGVNNTPIDKKERTNIAEVTSNDERIFLAADSFEKYRKRACEEMNSLFGWNVSVERRQAPIVNTNDQDTGDDSGGV